MIRIEELVKRPELLQRDTDVWTYLDNECRKRLDEFLRQYEAVRASETRSLHPIADYRALPFGKHVHDEFEWEFRQYSLRAIERLLRGRIDRSTLEIGPWNGWLSNRLVEMGCEVLAVDYFSDDMDGLRAQRHYLNRWRTLQMDIGELDFRDRSFDVVIVNHCLQFFANPASYIERLKSLLRDNGLLILSGLTFYRDASRKQLAVQSFRERFMDLYGFEVFFAPTKGYLDGDDCRSLLTHGITLRPHMAMLPRNALALLRPSRPWYGCGVWRTAVREHRRTGGVAGQNGARCPEHPFSDGFGFA